MADGKITIETSIDNAGALKDLNNLIKQVNSKGTKAASVTAKSFSGIGKAAGIGAKVATAAIGTVATAITVAGGAAIKTGIDFESAFAGVKKTVDAPKEVIDKLRESIINMSKEMPQSAAELAGIAEAAGQLGIETQNIEGFTKTMAQLGDATNMASTEAADSLARFANITGMSQTNFDRLGSVIVDLGNNMATTESEITAMGMRLAGAGHQVGMSEAQIMSFAAALSSVGIEAEAGGSAFSTVMSKMQLAVEQGGESLNDFANVAGMSADEFKAAFQKDAAGAIISFIKGLSNCESQGKSAIGVLDDMGITEIRQRDALLRAAGASDVFSKALEIGTQAWDENTALANEASQRYETLESKLSMMKNSASALGIQFKDSIDGQLRNAVQVGTDSINRLSDAFTNGGLDAAVSEAGDIIADLSVRVANSAPDMVRSASSLLKSFVQGISDHRGEILNAGIEVAKALAEGIADLLPSSMSKPAKDAISVLAKSMKSGGLKEAAEDVVNVFKNMANMAAKALKPAAKAIDILADNFDKLAPVAATAYVAIQGKGKIESAIASVQKLSKGIQKMNSWYKEAKKITAEYAIQQEAAIYTGRARNIEMTVGQKVIGALTGKVSYATAAQAAWNAICAANPIGLVITAAAALAAGLGILALTTKESSAAVSEESNALAENARQVRETQQARQESINGIGQEYGHYQQLWDELQQNVDANGKVKDGYEERAAFITSTLSNALSVEITMTDGVIDKYGELKESIDSLIEKKRQEAMLDAYKADYEEAVKNHAEANKELAKTYDNLQEAQNRVKEAQDKLKDSHSKSGYLYDQLKGNVDSANAALEKAESDYKNAKTAADEYNNTIANYEAASGAVISGSGNASTAITLMTNNMKTATTATEAELAKQVTTYQTEFENMKNAAAQGGSGITQQMVTDAQNAYLAAAEQHMIGQGMTQEQVAAGLEQLRAQIDASGLPDTAGAEATETAAAMGTGFSNGTSTVQTGADAMTQGAKSEIENSDLKGAATEASSGVGAAIGNNLSADAPAAAAGAAYLSDVAKNGVQRANIGAAYQTIGKGAGTQLAGALSSTSGSVNKSASVVAQGVTKTVTSANLPNNMLTAGKQTGQSLANGLQSQSGLVRSAADVLISSARNGVAQLSQAGHDAGVQFSNGLAAGIRSGAAGVRSAAAEIAQQAVTAAKANLDIHSPSKVMHEVGKWYDKGLETGIKRNADGVIEAVNGLTDILSINPKNVARSAQSAFDINIDRISARYASAQNRIPGDIVPDTDYDRLASAFAEKVIEKLGAIGIEVNQREFARLVREVE